MGKNKNKIIGVCECLCPLGGGLVATVVAGNGTVAVLWRSLHKTGAPFPPHAVPSMGQSHLEVALRVRRGDEDWP